MKTTIRKVFTSAATVIALALPQIAFGQTGILSMSGYEYSPQLRFNVTGHSNVGAGGFHASFDPTGPVLATSFVAYCVDLSQNFSFGSPFAVTATDPATMSAIGVVRTSVLDRLYTQQFKTADTGMESAAFQLAVWEILREAPAVVFGTNALGSGSFTATAATSGTTLDSQAITLANTWLNTLTGASGGYSLTVLASDTRQDQMMATPIPEPETYAMLLAGLGLMGFVVRRRQKALAA